MDDFKLASLPQSRTILRKFVKNDVMFNDLVLLLEDSCLSSFQLRDILVFNNSFEKIKSAIIE